MSGRSPAATVSHIVLTHNHFDHILGSSAFVGASVYCAPEVAATIANQTEHLRADAVRHGGAPDEVARAIAALRPPEHEVRQADRRSRRQNGRDRPSRAVDIPITT